jgi:hypothetical protein
LWRGKMVDPRCLIKTHYKNVTMWQYMLCTWQYWCAYWKPCQSLVLDGGKDAVCFGYQECTCFDAVGPREKGLGFRYGNCQLFEVVWCKDIGSLDGMMMCGFTAAIAFIMCGIMI